MMRQERGMRAQESFDVAGAIGNADVEGDERPEAIQRDGSCPGDAARAATHTTLLSTVCASVLSLRSCSTNVMAGLHV